jgi:glutamine amidotransferase PdxT
LALQGESKRSERDTHKRTIEREREREKEREMAVGVLALQGSFREHIACLRKLGVEAMEVRKPEQLEALAGLIIPGGESTTMAKLAEHYHLVSHNLTLKSNFLPCL